jgi:hypothetical protein
MALPARYPQLSAQAPTGRNEIARGKALRRPGSMSLEFGAL